MVKPAIPVDDNEQQERALALMNDLHAAGWANLWLESERIFGGGISEGKGRPQTMKFMLKVILPESRVDGNRMDIINELAAKHDAIVYLDELHLNQNYFSRVCLWPRSHQE